MLAANSETLIFPVETSFHQKVHRPGGLPRETALKYAKMQVLRVFIRCAQPIGNAHGMPIRAVPSRRPSRCPSRCPWPGTARLAMAAHFRFG